MPTIHPDMWLGILTGQAPPYLPWVLRLSTHPYGDRRFAEPIGYTPLALDPTRWIIADGVATYPSVIFTFPEPVVIHSYFVTGSNDDLILSEPLDDPFHGSEDTALKLELHITMKGD